MLGNLIRIFFSWYIDRKVTKHFAAFSYSEIIVDPERAVLMIANHFSWWDGFLMFQINRKLLKRNFHVMVTEENYKKVFFFKHLGAFCIKRNSKSAIDSLNTAGKLLNDKKNMVLIFPQGKLFSNHIDDVWFEKGLLNIINSSEKSFQYLFSSVFVDYFEKQKPSAYGYLQLWEDKEPINLQLLKDAYNQHYSKSRQLQCRITL